MPTTALSFVRLRSAVFRDPHLARARRILDTDIVPSRHRSRNLPIMWAGATSEAAPRASTGKPTYKTLPRSLHPPPGHKHAASSACRGGIIKANCEGSVGEQRGAVKPVDCGMRIRLESFLFFDREEGFSIHLGLCLATAGVGSRTRILAAAPLWALASSAARRPQRLQSGTGTCIHDTRSGESLAIQQRAPEQPIDIGHQRSKQCMLCCPNGSLMLSHHDGAPDA